MKLSITQLEHSLELVIRIETTLDIDLTSLITTLAQELHLQKQDFNDKQLEIKKNDLY
jgi:hypothetical protein